MEEWHSRPFVPYSGYKTLFQEIDGYLKNNKKNEVSQPVLHRFDAK
jgi:hypothetical protein